MIHIRRNFETLMVEFEITGVPAIGYHRFEVSMELLSADQELHDYYYAFRGYGTGVNHMRMVVTRQTEEYFFIMKTMADRARLRHVELCENNNLGARGMAEGSVLA